MTEFNLAAKGGELYFKPPLPQRLRNMAERIVDGVLEAPYGYDILYQWKPGEMSDEAMRERLTGLLREEGHTVHFVEVSDIVPRSATSS